MKIHHFIAPALALAGSAYWLNQQKVTINSLTEKKQIISKRLAIVAKAISDNPVRLGSAEASAQDEMALPDGSPDWKKITELIAASQNSGGMPTDIKAFLKIQKTIMELSEDEIIDGLTKISDSDFDVDEGILEDLKESLVDQLAETNPLAALNALDDFSSTPSLEWSQEQIFSKVIEEDLAAAVAWVDQQIAAGKFLSASLKPHASPRYQFEAALINTFLSSDLAAAKDRLSAFDDGDKAYLLSLTDLNENTEAGSGFVKLARENLPAEEASEAIVNAWENVNPGTLANISSSISDVPLSDSERSAVIEKMVTNYSNGKNSEAELAEIYQWSKAESPGQESRLVAAALANRRTLSRSPQQSFEKALALSDSLGDPSIATDFVDIVNKSGGQDSMLGSFNSPELAEQLRSMAAALPQESSDSE